MVTSLCSDTPVFQHLYIPAAQPMFRHPYVPTTLCSDTPLFRQPALKIVLARDWCAGARDQPMFRFITPRDLQGHAIVLQAHSQCTVHCR